MEPVPTAAEPEVRGTGVAGQPVADDHRPGLPRYMMFPQHSRKREEHRVKSHQLVAPDKALGHHRGQIEYLQVEILCSDVLAAANDVQRAVLINAGTYLSGTVRAWATELG
jgi:hypothetical protein